MAQALPHDELGEGEALVLLHAGIADRRMWSEHLEPLAAAGRRVVALDLPGFGEARATREPVAHWIDVLETLDALGIERAALVGNSFGGAVALRVAASEPQRVSSLHLFSAPAVPEGEPSPELLATWDAEEGAVAAGELEQAVAVVLASWVGAQADDSVRERIAAMQLENYRRHSVEEPLEQAEDPLESDAAPLAALRCPVLIAAGDGDMPDFRGAVSELAVAMPQAITVEIAGCGHLAPLEAPDEFRRLVLATLAREDGA